MANIALVDDDKNILTSVSMLLEQEGYHVRTFSDGASALTALTALRLCCNYFSGTLSVRGVVVLSLSP